MKAIFLAVATVCLLTACAGKPLTETECRTLIEKEIAFATHAMPAEEADSMRDFFKGDLDAKTAACVAAPKSSRKYYQCMVDAKNPAETQQCMVEESARK